MRSRVTLHVLPVGLLAAAWTAAWLYTWTTGGSLDAENILWTGVAMTAAISALLASRRAENRASARSFVLFGAGAFMWAIGQAVWTYYTLRGVEVPYPSLADVGYLAALPLFAAGILTWPRARQRRLAHGELLEMALGFGAVALVVGEFAIAPLLDDGIHGLTGALTLTYPIAEFGLAAVIIVGLLFGGWRDRGRLVLIMGGLLALAVGDTVFVKLDGVVAGAIEPAWTIPFLALGVAAALPPARRYLLRRTSWLKLILLLVVFTGLRGLQLAEAFAHESTIEWIENLALSLLLLAALARALSLGRSEREERQRSERLKAEVERAYSDRDAALEASRTGVALLADGEVRFWNAAFVELLDVEATGRGIAWTAFRERLDRMTRDELSFWRDDRYLRIRSTNLSSGERLVTVDDFTAEETEREDRDRFVAEVVQAREEEARMIAELLHDDALQELSALALRLELDALRSGNEHLVDFARDTNAISRSIRQLVVDLHPAVLESRGLSPAIEAAAQNLRAAGIEVTVDDLPLRFEPDLERLAYRLAQEGLANVLKHAEATHVEVKLQLRKGSLHFEIRDDGRGFEPAVQTAGLRHGRLGLHLARQRLDLVGGTLVVGPAGGRGTSFSFDLPVALRTRLLEATG
jgi:signal transduction histidine kinase